MDKLRPYVRAHAPEFLKSENITSVGIGYKSVGGEVTGDLAIQFTVATKFSPQFLAEAEIEPIPQTIEIDGYIIPTDVIERTYSPSYALVSETVKDARKARVPVMAPGISVGRASTRDAGTLGAFVRDKKTKQIVLLSNWHVLHGPQGAIGQDIVQPGPFDDNRTDRNRIGKLLRSHLGPAGDCAIASVSGREITNEILDLGIAFGRIGDPDLGDRVIKSGRTTAVTHGIVTRIEVNTRLTYGAIVQTIGGFEIGPDPKAPAPENEISRGGDSGSLWMAIDKNGKTTDIMLGLHFAGDNDEGGPSEVALACYAKSVLNKLEVEPVGAFTPQTAADESEALRTGFDADFLGFHIAVPSFTAARKKDLAVLDGDKELRYCHFSAWLSKQRRYPLCVAWNIDGGRYRKLNRTSFRADRRGTLEEYQLTNDIYVYNDLDKGHIARRADLCWGTAAEAKQGNYDSFYYTNIAPQHSAFNQSDNTSFDPDGGVWGRLENTVFDSESPRDLKLSLLGGPVFSSRDRKFYQIDEECYVPNEFWKVVAYADDEDGKNKVFAFLLTQAALVEPITRPEGLDFRDWLWARITLEDLEDKTGVMFAEGLKEHEVPFERPESLGGATRLKLMMSAAEYFHDPRAKRG